MTFWNFKPAAAADEVDLTVYGYIAESAIWDDETGARQFREELDAHKTARRINVRINSGGGDAFAGIAIHSMLHAHPAEISVSVEGLAASAASIIAMAGRVTMANGAMLMIHNPSALAMGEASELRKTAEVLDQLRSSLVSIYQAKTKLSTAKIEELLDAETWMSAAEAKALGFADEVVGQVVAEARGETVYFNAVGFPRNVAPVLPTPQAATVAPTAVAPAPPAPLPLTRDLLTAEAPQLVEALLAEGHDRGVQAERSRLRAIDDVAMPGHEALVTAARYEAPSSAAELALAIVRAERRNRTDYLSAATRDAAAADVPGAPLPTTSSDHNQTVAAIAAGGSERRTRR